MELIKHKFDLDAEQTIIIESVVDRMNTVLEHWDDIAAADPYELDNGRMYVGDYCIDVDCGLCMAGLYELDSTGLRITTGVTLRYCMFYAYPKHNPHTVGQGAPLGEYSFEPENKFQNPARKELAEFCVEYLTNILEGNDVDVPS